jgi:hypothetical protein
MHLIIMLLGVMLLFSPPVWLIGVALIVIGAVWACLH